MSNNILVSTNPGEGYIEVGGVEISSEQEVKEKVAKSRKAFLGWKELGVERRVEFVKNFRNILDKRREEIVKLMADEVGKPVSQGEMDIDSDLEYIDWYCENAAKVLAPVTTFENESEIHQVFYEPIGVAAVIQPWNYPTAQFVWGVIPTLLAGNTVVFKHSEECVLSGKLLEEMMIEAGFPEGVFEEVYGGGDIGEILINEEVNLINFTGSTKTGKHLYETGAKKMIKVLLELGGSAPGIVFEDAEVQPIIETIFFNRFFNSGQMCDALKRLIVHESKLTEVSEKLKLLLESKKVGLATDKSTDFGPLVAKRQLELLETQVNESVSMGAKIVTGGKKAENMDGAYYLPTVLTKVAKEMRVWKEEVFGPVLPIMTFKTEEEAIKLANDTDYGLGSYVWTSDKERANRVAAKLEAGMVSINSTNYIKPFNPFGGYKKSGIGREHGKWGLEELSQVKVTARDK